MGCGGAKATDGGAPTAVDEHKEEENQVWATKTEAGKRPAQQTVQTRTGSSQQQPPSKAFVLEDADDEIEIVDEGTGSARQHQQRQQQQPRSGSKDAQGNQVAAWSQPEPMQQRALVTAVANPSEAPQWGGDATGGQIKDILDEAAAAGVSQGAAKPLPKQQAEEAAKLAETRKRFDNQRYQANSSGTTNVGNAGPPPIIQTGDISAVPLSLTNTISTPKEQSKLGAFLPGGVLDDLELNDFAGAVEEELQASKVEEFQFDQPATQSPVTQKEKGQHGFDDADEALMKEILEDFDDV